MWNTYTVQAFFLWPKMEVTNLTFLWCYNKWQNVWWLNSVKLDLSPACHPGLVVFLAGQVTSTCNLFSLAQWVGFYTNPLKWSHLKGFYDNVFICTLLQTDQLCNLSQAKILWWMDFLTFPCQCLKLLHLHVIKRLKMFKCGLKLLSKLLPINSIITWSCCWSPKAWIL